MAIVADAFDYFETSLIPEWTDTLIAIEKLTRAEGLNLPADLAHECIVGLLKDVNDAAVRLAGLTDGIIIKHILATQSSNRPHQGQMEAHILSEPGPLGLIKVALMEELDKIINPNGYGPYWRAQEYGTGVDTPGGFIPEQEGRVFFGTFSPSELPPDPAQGGLGAGSDLLFQPQGSNPGWGTISVELPGRHFLRDGSAEAGLRYTEGMLAIEDKWVVKMEQILVEAQRQLEARSRDFQGFIEA